MTKNNPNPTIEAKIQEYRELGGNPAHEMWLRTALTTIDQNARKNTLEEVRRWFGSDYDPTSYGWIVQRLDHALSYPLNK